MARLVAPNGARVTVDDSRVERLLSRGFTSPEPEKKPAKKAASSSKKSD